MKYYIFPRIQDILFIIIFIAAILLGPRMLNQDGDLPRHMAIGRYVLSGHLPPTNDIFSHTVPGVPFAPHKWLSGVLFYLAYVIFDERGMVILSAIALGLTFMLIYIQSVSRTGLRLLTFILIAWGAMLTSLHWIVRPHIFTMLLFAIWIVLTDKLTHGEKVKLWYFPLLMFLWNNIHGEYIAGFLVTGAYIAGWCWDYIIKRDKASLEIGKRLFASAALSLLVTILNPISVQAWGTVTDWMGNEYLMSHTEETLPPNFLDPKYLILLVLLLLSVFLVAMNWKKLSAGQMIALAGFSVLTLTSARNIHFYGIIAPFILASTLTGSLKVKLVSRYESFSANIESRLKGFVWPPIIIIIGILTLLYTPIGQAEHFSPSFFPVDAVKWLQIHPQSGEMFNPFDWGGYLSLMLPEKKVFIDSQGDVYGEAFIRKYEQVVELLPGWQGILDNYQVSWALVPINWPLIDSLSKAGWKEVYKDNTAVVLTRGP